MIYSRCQVLCVFVLTYLKQYVKTYRVIKISVQLLIKKHASRELLSFRVLKIPFIKKSVEHSQNERVKKTSSSNKFC